MTPVQKQLFTTAFQARKNAYAPYSGFTVGAAVLTVDGEIFAGCNVENAAYPCGTCAEAGAIANMIANGHRHIQAILILADTKCILPCGNCLQKIAEFGNADTLIYCANVTDIVKTCTLAELLPQNFKAKDINHA